MDEPTGVALIVVGDDGENQIVVAPGANAAAEAPHGLEAADAVLCQLEIPVKTVAEAARRRAVHLPERGSRPRAPRRSLDDVDLLVVNRYEQEAVGRFDGLTALTLGADGAVLLEGGREIARAAPPGSRQSTARGPATRSPPASWSPCSKVARVRKR